MPPSKRARASLRFSCLALAALVGGAAAAAISVACGDPDVYVYSAQKFDRAGLCVEPYAPLELVSGPGAGGACPAICLTVGVDLYVSTMCPPLPAIATAVPADSADCIAALEAAQRGALCGDSARAEGGREDDGGLEARVDAADDAEPIEAAADAADGSPPIADAGDAG